MDFNVSNLLYGTVNWMSNSTQLIATAPKLPMKLKQLLSPSASGLQQKERRLLLAIQRQMESIIGPLQYCMLWVRYRNSSIGDTIQNVQEILLSVCAIIQPYLSKGNRIHLYAEMEEEAQNKLHTPTVLRRGGSSSNTEILGRKQMVEDLKHCKKELDLATSWLNLSLHFIQTATRISPSSIPAVHAEPTRKEALRTPISPSALLKASHRLEKIRDRCGDISICMGRFYYRIATEEWDDRVDGSRQDGWRVLNLSEWKCFYPVALMRLCKSTRDKSIAINIEAAEGEEIQSTRSGSENSGAAPASSECYEFSLSSGMFTYDEEVDDSDLLYIADPEQIRDLLLGVPVREADASRHAGKGTDMQRLIHLVDRREVIQNHSGTDMNMDDTTNVKRNPDGLPHAFPPDLAAAISCRKLCLPISAAADARLTTESSLEIGQWSASARRSTENEGNGGEAFICLDKKVMVIPWAFSATYHSYREEQIGDQHAGGVTLKKMQSSHGDSTVANKSYQSPLVRINQAPYFSDSSNRCFGSSSTSPRSSSNTMKKTFDETTPVNGKVCLSARTNEVCKKTYCDEVSCRHSTEQIEDGGFEDFINIEATEESSGTLKWLDTDVDNDIEIKEVDERVSDNADPPALWSEDERHELRPPPLNKELANSFVTKPLKKKHMKLSVSPVNSPHQTTTNISSAVNPPQRYVVHYAFVFDNMASGSDSEVSKYRTIENQEGIHLGVDEEFTEIDFMYLCRLCLLNESSFEMGLNNSGDEAFWEVLKNIYISPSNNREQQ